MLDNPNVPDIGAHQPGAHQPGAHQIGAYQTGVCGKSPPRHEAFDLREWVSFAWRHWKFIAAITSLALVVGTAYLFNQTRLYTATAQVLLDPQKERMPGGDTTQAEMRLSLAAMDSQIAIIRSTVFLRARRRARPILSRLFRPPPKPLPPRTTRGPFGAARGFVLGLIGSWRGEEHGRETGRAGSTPCSGGATPYRRAELRAIEALRESLQVARGAAAGLHADSRGDLARPRRGGPAGQCGGRDLSGR